MIVDAMAPTPSRIPELQEDLPSAGCPRCGARLAETYKYCPHCAYRLRPDVRESPAPLHNPPTTGQRLLAVGGYLAFTSLLLLVVLAGIQIFVGDGAPLPTNRSALSVPRDPEAGRIVLDRDSFREVRADAVIWGLYRPSDPDWNPASLLHTLVDDTFLLATSETTNDQYYAFLLARAKKSGKRIPDRFYPTSWKRSSDLTLVRRIYDTGTGNYPVTEVDFAAALEFCAFVWEEVFASQPDLVVDLPTAQEFVLAGRRGRLELNFPWGSRLDDPDAHVVLEGSPLPVRDARVGEYGGFFGLVGNVAEWVHVGRRPQAAGWSYRDVWYRSAWEEGRVHDLRTPFSPDGFEPLDTGPAQPHVGFRVAVRRAPVEPRFVPCGRGTARHVTWENPVLPPPIARKAADPEMEEGDDVERLPPITFLSADRTVVQDFEISQGEITNRQFLAYLASIASERNAKQMQDLAIYPGSFARETPFARVDPVYTGHYGDPRKVRFLYEAGRENHPAEGVRLEQALDYAHWLSRRAADRMLIRLPNIGEYLRAGRGDGTMPYPPPITALSPDLICADRTGDEARAASLLGSEAAARGEILGLVGNVLEYVRDEIEERTLLAGGCYLFPKDACTLDSFLDPAWKVVDVPEEYVTDDGNLERRPRPVNISVCTGFRLVRLPRIF